MIVKLEKNRGIDKFSFAAGDIVAAGDDYFDNQLKKLVDGKNEVLKEAPANCEFYELTQKSGKKLIKPKKPSAAKKK